MAVITKKDEKAMAVIEKMNNQYDEQEFKNLFKETYPNDWEKIIRKYQKEERKDVKGKGKGHPMPDPDTYLHNMYNVVRNKQQK